MAKASAVARPVKRAPKSASVHNLSAAERRVIDEGGANSSGEKRRLDSIPIRLTRRPDLLARIDGAVAARDVPISRNSWLIEACLEKLTREKA